MKKIRIVLLLIIALLIILFFSFNLEEFLTLEFFKSKQIQIYDYYQSHFFESAIIYLCIYITITSLALPLTAVMTLVGGAVFGLVWGTLLVSIAATIGATVSFLASRFLFRELIQNKFSDRLKIINKGIEDDGALYLLTLRLVPIFPYFIINPVMGLTPIRTHIFFFVTMLGMLPASIIFVNAGKQISKIREVGDILSPELLASLVLLGIFPLIAKKSIDFFKSRRKSKQLGFGQNEDG